VAINNDPEAAIFERANFGIVADWAVILPAMQEVFRGRLT
jgi:electron transfer flavoprotein alpha subunit